MIKMIGWIEGVISEKGYSEYLAFYTKDGKLIVDPFIYGDTLRRVEMNELLKNITVSNNKCTVDFSNYESFHYFISAQCFKSETDICNTKWYGKPVSEEDFNKYLAESTNQINDNSFDENIFNTFKNNDFFKEICSNITKNVSENILNGNISEKNPVLNFEELMKLLSNTDGKVSLLSNNESDKKETNDHFKCRLFGWISFDNLRTAIFINKDESQFDTISFDVTTKKIVNDPFKFDFINNTVFFKENNLLTFNRLIINSNNIEKDIIDFEDRDINCTVSKEEFLEIIGLKEINFSYDSLMELLQEKQIDPLEIAMNYRLL